mmetsp:Transcript_14166/g.24978  ORF Transcript_14166/g.24978 Transcript_14166/m.24978 type:complete len:238 (+) Transcript_14166:141-854(+)
MGCGASVQHAPKEEKKVEEPEEVTWATKTAASADVSDPEGYGHAGKGGLHSKHEQNCVLLDAEDNDEIEIIYEVQPKRQNHLRPAAANGQEAPEAAELDALPSSMQPKPLSKQQQEEAAKLAERRKRFDNQRYQREQSSSENSPPGANNPGPMFNSKPTTDMILGLNLTDIGSKDQDPHGGFLPGGILDDAEEFQSTAVRKDVGKKNKHTHDDIKSSGFDADDERLMKEILENCDDV